MYMQSVDTSPLKSAADVQQLLLSTFAKELNMRPNASAYLSYYVYVFPSIDRTPSLKPSVKTLAKGTHIYHSFSYVDYDPRVVHTRKWTGVADFVVQQFVDVRSNVSEPPAKKQ